METGVLGLIVSVTLSLSFILRRIIRVSWKYPSVNRYSFRKERAQSGCTDTYFQTGQSENTLRIMKSQTHSPDPKEYQVRTRVESPIYVCSVCVWVSPCAPLYVRLRTCVCRSEWRACVCECVRTRLGRFLVRTVKTTMAWDHKVLFVCLT